MIKDLLSGTSQYQIVKRIFDITMATITLIFVAPLVLLVSLAIIIDSPGPLMYQVVRLGHKGRIFKYYKFRTMRVDSELLNTGPVFDLRRDPRITRVGSLLRKTGIDELPLFLSVLKGDMSFVGPRAALPLEVEHYSENQRRRFEVKPGLTGYWQVFGKNSSTTDLNKMIEMDLEYIDKQSLLMDLKILFRTMQIILTNKGVY